MSLITLEVVRINKGPLLDTPKDMQVEALGIEFIVADVDPDNDGGSIVFIESKAGAKSLLLQCTDTLSEIKALANADMVILIDVAVTEAEGYINYDLTGSNMPALINSRKISEMRDLTEAPNVIEEPTVHTVVKVESLAAVVATGGSGYLVSEVLTLVGGTGTDATATISKIKPVNAQTQADYNNSPTGEGTFVVGAAYEVADTITLSDGTINTVTAVRPVAAQDETDFDGVGTNGTFTGGGAGAADYAPADTITMSDGTIITVDAVSGAGAVTEFTVTTPGTTGVANEATLTQTSTSGTGAGFTLTLGVANQAVNSFSVVSTASTGSATDFPTLTQSSTSGTGTGFTMTLDTLNQAVHTIGLTTAGAYSEIPTPITAVPTTGSVAGTGAVVSIDFEVDSVVVDDGGTGLVSVSVSFAGGGGSGAAASGTVTGGALASVTVSAPGNNYTSIPTAVITETGPTRTVIRYVRTNKQRLSRLQVTNSKSSLVTAANATTDVNVLTSYTVYGMNKPFAEDYSISTTVVLNDSLAQKRIVNGTSGYDKIYYNYLGLDNSPRFKTYYVETP